MVYRPQTSHAAAVMIRLICVMAWACGVHLFAGCHGFVTEAGEAMLAKGKSIHMTVDWIMHVLRPAIVCAYIREFMEANPGVEVLHSSALCHARPRSQAGNIGGKEPALACRAMCSLECIL